MTQFLPHHPLKSGPLFTYNDGSFLTWRWLSTLLKQVIPSQDQSQISTHSFRIGAATTTAAAGFSKWLIQQLGRWNSDCFRDIPSYSTHHVAPCCQFFSHYEVCNIDAGPGLVNVVSVSGFSIWNLVGTWLITFLEVLAYVNHVALNNAPYRNYLRDFPYPYTTGI